MRSFSPSPAIADSVVGTGTASSCTEAALGAALAAAGSVTFNCGPNPVTIMVTSTISVSAESSIDGGDLVSLSGGGTMQLLTVKPGAILTIANLTISDGVIAIRIQTGGALNVSNVTFSDNHTDFARGSAIDSSGMLNVASSRFEDNTIHYISANGGAIGIGSGTAVVSGSTFSNNSAGAIDNSGILTVTDSIFSGNSATAGGALNNGGTLNVVNSTFANNSANFGGAISTGGDRSVTITGCTFSRNNSSTNGRPGYISGSGGAIFGPNGTFDVSDSTFSGNSAVAGGAIYYSGVRLRVTNSTFVGNSASAGGAIVNGGALAVSNSTFSTNSARSAGGGIDNSGTVTVINSTFVGNTSSLRGSAIYNVSGGKATLSNTILAPGTGANCLGTISDGGHNIDSGANCGFGNATGSLSNTDALLDPAGLADNGGSTQTIALQAGSLAVGAGDETICAAAPVNGRDQRGYERPQLNCSIGAYEYNSLGPAPICIGDCSGDAQVTVDELVTMVNIALGTKSVETCIPGDVNGDRFITVDEILAAVNNTLNGCPTTCDPALSDCPMGTFCACCCGRWICSALGAPLICCDVVCS